MYICRLYFLVALSSPATDQMPCAYHIHRIPNTEFLKQEHTAAKKKKNRYQTSNQTQPTKLSRLRASVPNKSFVTLISTDDLYQTISQFVSFPPPSTKHTKNSPVSTFSKTKPTSNTTDLCWSRDIRTLDSAIWKWNWNRSDLSIISGSTE